MPAIKSTAEIARKWAEVTPGRSGEYDKGVRNPKKDWAKKTADANAAYKEGIQESIAKDRFKKGVEKAGTTTWQKGAVEKGTSRFGPGVAVAEDKYEKGFAPYRDTIEKTALPPRFKRRDPRNIERVVAMVNALSKTKADQLS